MLVDRIDLTPAFVDVVSDRDIQFAGHVSWVGSSSMETTVEVTQEDFSGNCQKLLGKV